MSLHVGVDMDKFFKPQSVAIIGASEKLRFGYFVTKSILSRNDMRVYPVHLYAEEVMGIKAYRSIGDIPGDVDLAIFLVASETAPEAMEECARKGVKHVIILSAGFSEVDEIGAQRQERIVEIARANGMRVIGPNCVGVTNMSNRFTTTETDLDSLERGKLAFIAQSGIFGTAVIDRVAARRIGLSNVVTLGNKSDVDEIDVLQYLENDKETGVICLYLEGIKEGRGRKFIETFKRVTRKKPVLVLKSGRTRAGARSVMSHTGSMAGDDSIFDAVMRQTGAIRVDSVEELLDFAAVLTTQPIPQREGIAVITNSGSLASIACDELEEQGMELAALEPQTIEKMSSLAPSWTSLKNPVDIGPSMLMVGTQILEAVLEDRNVGCLLLISSVPGIVVKPDGMNVDLVPFYGGYRKIMEDHSDKTIIVSSFGDRDMVNAGIEVFDRTGIPLISSVQHAARAIGVLYRYKEYLDRCSRY